MTTSLREALLAKRALARAVLHDMARQPLLEPTAVEWQKGYVKALEESLDLEGISLRRHPRRPTDVPAEIVRVPPEGEGVPQSGKGAIVDLSVGGCGLATVMELSGGDVIELSFRLPASGTPIVQEGSVRRIQPLNGNFKVGVEFKGEPRERSRFAPA